jgi:hypothetical protein
MPQLLVIGGLACVLIGVTGGQLKLTGIGEYTGRLQNRYTRLSTLALGLLLVLLGVGLSVKKPANESARPSEPSRAGQAIEQRSDSAARNATRLNLRPAEQRGKAEGLSIPPASRPEAMSTR